MLILHNTLTGKKELFIPIKSPAVSMYVCGITPYDYAHIGHGRVYVTFDVLFRLLMHLGYFVTYCRNFTDIDDKLISKAQQELNDKMLFGVIANTFIKSFHEDVDALGCLRPTYEPRVTEHINDIIEFIQQLIQRGHAYVVEGDVYFSIPSAPTYAKLSKHNLADLRAGTRVEVSEKKRDPLDFALWKSEPEKTFWKSPWGFGRPGWHIECSVLAYIFLGKQIDIHGGGMDLIFPHHDNEIVQTESFTGLPFARYWIHNAFVRIDQEKMSKSLGNYFTIKEVLKKYDPMVLRFYYLNHHYRSPLDFSLDDLEAMQKSYQKILRAFEQSPETERPDKINLDHPIAQKMMSFLCDDLNTPGMLGVLFSHLDVITADQSLQQAVKYILHTILGLSLKPLPEETVIITPEIQSLIDERERARKAKDWKKADAIREQLLKLGIEVKDTKL